MSSEAAPLSELSREELINRIEALQRQNDALEARVDAMNKKLDRIVATLIGQREPADHLGGDVDLLSRVQEAESLAESAIGVAKTTTNVDPGTKKAFAARLTLFAIAKRHYGRKDMAGAVTTGSLKDMARGHDVELASRSILDAWTDLQDDWTCFEQDTVGKGPKETDRLKLTAQDLPAPLCRTVADDDLSNDGLAETLIMRANQTGGS